MLDAIIKHQAYVCQTFHSVFLNHDYTEEYEFKSVFISSYLFFSV